MKMQLLFAAALFAIGCGGGETIVTVDGGGGGGGTCGNITCTAQQECCFVNQNGSNVEACVALGSCNNGGGGTSTTRSSATSSTRGAPGGGSSSSSVATSSAAAGCTPTSCTGGVCCAMAGGGSRGGFGGGAPTMSCQATCTNGAQEVCTVNGGIGGNNTQGTCPAGMVCRLSNLGVRTCQMPPPVITMDAGAVDAAPPPRDAATGG